MEDDDESQVINYRLKKIRLILQREAGLTLIG